MIYFVQASLDLSYWHTLTLTCKMCCSVSCCVLTVTCKLRINMTMSGCRHIFLSRIRWIRIHRHARVREAVGGTNLCLTEVVNCLAVTQFWSYAREGVGEPMFDINVTCMLVAFSRLLRNIAWIKLPVNMIMWCCIDIFLAMDWFYQLQGRIQDFP